MIFTLLKEGSPPFIFSGFCIMGKKHNLHVGRIHADWCGHCVALKDQWAKLKHKFHQNVGRSLKRVTIEHHDFEDSEDRKRQGHFVDKELEHYNNTHLAHSPIKVALQNGYPTIFRVLNGHLEYHSGDRTAEPMFDWFTRGITNQSGGGTKKKRSKRSRKNRKRSRRTRSHRKRNLLTRLFL